MRRKRAHPGGSRYDLGFAWRIKFPPRSVFERQRCYPESTWKKERNNDPLENSGNIGSAQGKIERYLDGTSGYRVPGNRRRLPEGQDAGGFEDETDGGDSPWRGFGRAGRDPGEHRGRFVRRQGEETNCRARNKRQSHPPGHRRLGNRHYNADPCGYYDPDMGDQDIQRTGKAGLYLTYYGGQHR